MMDEGLLRKMIEEARVALTRAHTPVSSFPVGAAVLTRSGDVYAGCNTESIIAGLGSCAERTAVDHAVVHGEKEFLAVVVVSQRSRPLFPCGVCRQYLFEFAQAAGLDPMIYALGADGTLESSLLSRLLPEGFGPLDKGRSGE
ncbi:MAG: cytidine deaminase [Thermodesulfobacteriota bacterium]